MQKRALLLSLKNQKKPPGPSSSRPGRVQNAVIQKLETAFDIATRALQISHHMQNCSISTWSCKERQRRWNRAF